MIVDAQRDVCLYLLCQFVNLRSTPQPAAYAKVFEIGYGVVGYHTAIFRTGTCALQVAHKASVVV